MTLSRTELLAWLGIALAVPYVLALGGTLSLQASAEGRIILQGLMLAAAAAGLFIAARRPGVLRSGVTIAGAAFVVVGMTSAFVSQRPAASLEAAALLVLSAPCYLAIRAAAHSPALQTRLHWLLAVCALLVLVPYLVTVLLAWAAWWSAVGPSLPPLRPGNSAGTVGNSNALATYTYLLAPIAALGVWRWRRGRFVGVAIVALAVFALVTSGSRGAWLGAAAGIVVAGLMVGIGMRGTFRRPRRGRLILAAALATVAAVAVVAGPAILERFATGDAGRLELWRASASIFLRHPLLGGGIGSWQGLRPLEPIADPNTASLQSPHDIWLHVAAEMGGIGLVAFAILSAAIARAAWAARRPGSHLSREELVVVAGSLAALAVHALVDPQFALAAVVLMTMYLVARLEPPPADAGPVAARARWPVALAAAATIVAVVALVPVDLAMLDGRAGNRALDRGDWAVALQTLDRAAARHDLGIYESGRAIALSRLDRPAEALEALERMRRTDPFSFIDAQIAVLAAGDFSRSLAAATAVDAVGAYDPTATLNAAVAASRSDPSLARSMLADAIVATPFLDLRTPPAGVPVDLWSAAVVDAIDQRRGSDPMAAAGIAAESGDLSLARRVASEAPDTSEQKIMVTYLDALAGQQQPLDRTRALVGLAPSPRALVWYARIARLAGSERDELRAGVMMALLFSGSPLVAPAVDATGTPRPRGVARLLYYPEAFSFREGPRHPYVMGMATIVSAEWHP